MRMTRSPKLRPCNLFALLFGMVLGACSVQVFGTPRAYADVNPSFYNQGETSNSSPSSASQTMSLPDEAPTPSPGIFSTLIRVIVALAVTLGLILATVLGLKWLWEKRGWNQWAEEGKAVKILATTYLAPQKAVYLLEVGKRILVVGVGGDKITCLDVIRDREEVESLRGTAQQGFPKVFNRVIRNQDTADHEAETKRILEESNQVVGGYVAKLRGIKKKKNNPGSVDEG